MRAISASYTPCPPMRRTRARGCQRLRFGRRRLSQSAQSRRMMATSVLERKADEVDEQRMFGAFFDFVETLGCRVSAIHNLLIPF
jgi:hypothetical protein